MRPAETIKVKGYLQAVAWPSPIELFYFIGGLFLIFRYYWLLDDAFIYFRYIDNFTLLNQGLVYNAGEYVEGFSSPFWTLTLSLFRVIHLNYLAIINILAVLSFGVFFLMLVKVNRGLSPSKVIVNFPLAYLAFNYAVACYFTSGMETPFVQVIAIAYALYILNPASLSLQILLAISPLIRPELTVPLAICMLWAWIYSRKFPWKIIFLTIIFAGSWVIFRIYYYADLFPNTFYLKDTVDMKQGYIYLLETVNTYHLQFIAGGFLLLTILIKLISPKKLKLDIPKRLVMIIAAASVTLFVVKIGGDPRHYRYLAFPFCLTVCAFAGILEHFIDTIRLSRYKFIAPLTGIIISLMAFSFYPRQLRKHPCFSSDRSIPINKIKDAQDYRQTKGLWYSNWGKRLTVEKILKYKNNSAGFKYTGTKADVWCRTNYVDFFEKRTVHALGLTDAILARTEMKAERPAHKYGLLPLADDIVSIHESATSIGRGMYREAVENGTAPEWIEKNLDSIEIIERKIYNNHNIWENIKLAFTFPPKIKP